MVVKLLHTVVADGTVGAAGRPPMVACGTPFGLDNETIDLVLLMGRPAPAALPDVGREEQTRNGELSSSQVTHGNMVRAVM